MDAGPSQRQSVIASNRRFRELENVERECECGYGRGCARVHNDDADIAMDDDLIHDAPVMKNIAMKDDPIGDDAAIWNSLEEMGALKCYSHSSKICSWAWWEHGKKATFVNIVKMSGLAYLVRCTYRFVNKIIVSREMATKDKYLPFDYREMTIMLDDVATILELPIVGKYIGVHKLSERQAIALVVNNLGIDEQEVRHEISSVGENSVMLEWLRENFHNVTYDDSVERITCVGRAYLLFLLGSTLFSDKTDTRVPVVYLSLLSDLTTVHSYAWVVAALAYLYRQLGYASKSSVKQITGYMTLLKGWIFEYFRGF
ncbi:protein MAIN-LIKE 2-like [Camellia sinensis]|uniref:protein MAIN-LIKE 2-like n=1 Tax=Camellia sinensis TaxID=4442 RepID=UPI001036DBD2|nr:protein MAIN-LIKE 2-like [Camellia sinensis]